MRDQLTRDTNTAVLGGVCSGLGQYFKIPAIVFRLLFILLLIIGGAGVFLYGLLWLVIPSSYMSQNLPLFPYRFQALGTEFSQLIKKPNPQTIIYVAVALILGGTYALLRVLKLPWLEAVNFDLVLPISIIVLGLVFLFFALKKR